MADYQVTWNPITKAVFVQDAGDTPPSGSTVIKVFEHDEHDELGEGEGSNRNHVLFHHVRDALYFVGHYSMQRVSIIDTSEGNSTPIPNPEFTSNPILSGSGKVGTKFTFTNGTVSGGSIISNKNRLKAGSSTRALGNTAIANYTIVEGDIGLNFTLEQTGANVLNIEVTGTSNVIVGQAADVVLPVISIQAPVTPSQNEGATFVFRVNRTGSLVATSSVNYATSGTGGNPANATDFVGGVFPSGSVNFGIGENYKEINIATNNDSTIEPNEGFRVTISGVSGGTLGTTTADAVIINNDSEVPAPVYSQDPVLTGTTDITGVLTVTDGVSSNTTTRAWVLFKNGIQSGSYGSNKIFDKVDLGASDNDEFYVRERADNGAGVYAYANSNTITTAAEEWPKTVTGVGASSGMLNASTVNQEISLLKPVGQIEFDLGIGMDATGANGLIYRFASGFFTLYFVNAGVETSSAFVNFKALNFEGLTVGDRLRARIYEPLEGETLGDIALFVNDTEVPESRLLGSHFTAGNAPRSTYCKYVRTFGAATVDVTYGPFPDGDGGVVDDNLIDNPLGTPEDRAGVTATTELLDAKGKAHYFEVDLPSPGAEFKMVIDAVDDQNFTELNFFNGDRLTLTKFVGGTGSILGSRNFWQIPTGTPQTKIRFIQDSPSNDLRLIIDDVEVEAFKVLGANRGGGVGNGEQVQFVKTSTATPFDLHWGPANSIPLNITDAIYNQGAQRIEFSIDYGAKPKGFFYSTNGGATLTRAILVDNLEAGKADYQSEVVDISSSFNLYVENVEDDAISDTFAVPVYAPMEMGYAADNAYYWSPFVFLNNWGKHSQFIGYDETLIYCPENNITGSGTIRTSLGTTLAGNAISPNVTVHSSNPATGVHTYTISGPGEPTVFKWTGTKPTRFDVEPSGASGYADTRWINSTGSGAGFRTLNLRTSNFGTMFNCYVDDPLNYLTSENRPKEDDPFWEIGGRSSYSNGVPFETMVKLANACKGAFPERIFRLAYVEMLGAADDAITEFWEYVRDNLLPGILLHHELSNEDWNWNLMQGRNRIRCHAEALVHGFYHADADGNPCDMADAVTGLSANNPSPPLTPMYIHWGDPDPLKTFAQGEYILDGINRLFKTKRAVAAGAPIVAGDDFEVIIGGSELIGGGWDNFDKATHYWLAYRHNQVLNIGKAILGDTFAEIVRPTICWQSPSNWQSFEYRLNYVAGYAATVTHLGQGFYLNEYPEVPVDGTVTKEKLRDAFTAGLTNGPHGLQASVQAFAAMCAAHGYGCFWYEGGHHWQGNSPTADGNTPNAINYRTAFYDYQNDPMIEPVEEAIVRVMRDYGSGPAFYFSRLGTGGWRLQRGLVADNLDYRLNGHLAGFED